MDTGWFRHKNTTPATFALAAKLQEAGARPTDAYRSLFEGASLGRLKLTGLVLQRLQRTTTAASRIRRYTRVIMKRPARMPQDSEDFINYVRSVDGVEVALFFMEQPRGGVKVSFRSLRHRRGGHRRDVRRRRPSSGLRRYAARPA